MPTARANLELTLSAKNLASRAFLKMQRELKDVRRIGKRAFDTLKRSAFSAQGAVAGLAGSFALFEGLVRRPADFAEGLAKVGSLGAEARAEWDRFNDEIRVLGVQSGQSFENLNAGLFDVISGITDAAGAMDVLKDANKLAIAGSADLSVTVKGVGKVMEAYNIAAEDAEKATKVLFAAQVVGATTIEELAANIGKVTGSATNAGASLEDMAGTLSFLTRQLANTEEASTSLNALFLALDKPSQNLQKVFDALGASGGQLVREQGLFRAMQAIGRGAREAGIAVNDLFVNQRALRAAIPLLRNEGEKWAQTMIGLRKNANELGATYDLMQEQFNTQAGRLRNFAETIAGEFSKGLFDDFLIDIDEMIGKSDDAGEALKRMAESAKEAGKNVTREVSRMGSAWSFAMLALSGDGEAARKELQKLSDIESRDPFFGDLFGARAREDVELTKEAGERIKQLQEQAAVAASKTHEWHVKNADRLKAQVILRAALARQAEHEADLMQKFRNQNPEHREFFPVPSAQAHGKTNAELQEIVELHLKAKMGIEAIWQRPFNAEASLRPLVEDWEEAFENLLSMSRDGVNEANAELGRLLEEQTRNLRDNVEQTASGALHALVDGLRSGADSGDIFRNVANSIIDSLINIQVQAISTRIALGLVGGGGGTGGLVGAIVGGLFGGGGGGGQLARGGVVDGQLLPFRQFASGGIADRPTLALMAEVGQKEAAVPLKNNRFIPVDLGEGGAGTTNIYNISAIDSRGVADFFAREDSRRFQAQNQRSAQQKYPSLMRRGNR